MSKPVTYAQVTQALCSQGIPYNPNTVSQMCDQHGSRSGTHMGSLQKYCGCGAKPRLDSYGIVRYDCGCSAGKPKLN